MPNPHLGGVQFPKLTKTGTSEGIVTGLDIATGNALAIWSKKSKKLWLGTVGERVLMPPDSWNVTVQCIDWDQVPLDTPETVTVVVANPTGPSNPVTTTSDIP